MNPPSPRLEAALESALQRVRLAARQAAERSVDSLGLAALSAMSIRERDDRLAAQFELNRRLAAFGQAFDEALARRLDRERGRLHGSRLQSVTPWESLSLVDDRQVEAQVEADRFGLAIQHQCEWELRELDAYIGSLLRLDRQDSERNPLRPEAIGLAMVEAVDTVSERAEVRKLLAAEIGRGLVTLMRQTYADIVAELRRDGVQPLGLALRSRTGGRPDEGDSRPAALDPDAGVSTRNGGSSGHGGAGTSGGGGFGSSTSGGSRGGVSSGAGAGRWDAQRNAHAIDEQLAVLIRRLAQLGPALTSNGPLSDRGGVGGASDAGPGSDSGIGLAGHGASTGGGALALQNLIVAHREELRQAATGTLDHMVIDVVGSLFDQILSDPKVPPQMARQIARLQLPVLRVALSDVGFFSSRRHPVRQFVNRIASLACAFDDLGQGAGRQLLERVRELVQQIVSGDFDRMALYEHQLAELETFIAEAARDEIRPEDGADDPAQLLAQRERELMQQQRYMQQLQGALTAVDMQDFLRDFLAQVWSQALVQARQRDGADSPLAQRLRNAGRELVMSVQPKGTPTERKAFLMRLPPLMKDLTEGMALIGWPEAARHDFFAQLLPAHAESLKGQSMRTLDHNLLVKQLDAILNAPVPEPNAAPLPGSLLPTLDEVVMAPDLGLNDAQAQAVGLVRESQVDWTGAVDIDLSDEPELGEVDIHIDGLSAAEPAEPAEPTRGAALAEHVQLGFAYQMHLEGEWQKVRLTYISPGRAFFIFSRGRKHQKTITLTARMLRRLCESARMRAFENAYLLERATARARKQLAALAPAAVLRPAPSSGPALRH